MRIQFRDVMRTTWLRRSHAFATDGGGLLLSFLLGTAAIRFLPECTLMRSGSKGQTGFLSFLSGTRPVGR